ncbi:MAG: hypothetical protein ACOX6X_05625 [Dethiobacteria bacterium]|jgi:hypothetical protein
MKNDLQEVKDRLLETAPEMKIPCVMVFKVARDFGLSAAEVGKLCNELKIKIINCQIGCF